MRIGQMITPKGVLAAALGGLSLIALASSANAANVPLPDSGVTSLSYGQTYSFAADAVDTNSDTYTWDFKVPGSGLATASYSAAPIFNLSTFSLAPAFSNATIELVNVGTSKVVAESSIPNFGGLFGFGGVIANLKGNTEYALEVIAQATSVGNGFSGTLNVSPVPLPGAVLLFGSSLLGLAGFGARKARRSTSA